MTNDEYERLTDKFISDILPFCETHNYCLHDLFDYARHHSPQMYLVISRLWSCARGKTFLRACFKNRSY